MTPNNTNTETVNTQSQTKMKILKIAEFRPRVSFLKKKKSKNEVQVEVGYTTSPFHVSYQIDVSQTRDKTSAKSWVFQKLREKHEKQENIDVKKWQVKRMEEGVQEKKKEKEEIEKKMLLLKFIVHDKIMQNVRRVRV